eukprot:2961080-Rhodomonas_salina.2
MDSAAVKTLNAGPQCDILRIQDGGLGRVLVEMACREGQTQTEGKVREGLRVPICLLWLAKPGHEFFTADTVGQRRYALTPMSLR